MVAGAGLLAELALVFRLPYRFVNCLRKIAELIVSIAFLASVELCIFG